MNLVTKLLASGGIAVALAAGAIGTPTAPAAAFSASDSPTPSGIVFSQPAPEDPLEDRIKKTIEDVNQEGQTALRGLGELDTPEKVEHAYQVLEQMERAVRDLRSRLHNRVSDRLEELNDLALSRLDTNAFNQLSELGKLDTLEKSQQAADIRAKTEQRRATMEEHFGRSLSRLREHSNNRALPRYDVRAVPHRRASRINSVESAEEYLEPAAESLRQGAQAALENLGELDAPGKIRQAEMIEARLAAQIGQLQRRAEFEFTRYGFEREMERRSQELRRRGETEIRILESEFRPRIEALIQEIRDRLTQQTRAMEEHLAESINQAGQSAVEQIQAVEDSVQEQVITDFEQGQAQVREEHQRQVGIIQELLDLEIQNLERRLHQTVDAGSNPEYEEVELRAQQDLENITSQLRREEDLQKRAIIDQMNVDYLNMESRLSREKGEERQAQIKRELGDLRSRADQAVGQVEVEYEHKLANESQRVQDNLEAEYRRVGERSQSNSRQIELEIEEAYRRSERDIEDLGTQTDRKLNDRVWNLDRQVENVTHRQTALISRQGDNYIRKLREDFQRAIHQLTQQARREIQIVQIQYRREIGEKVQKIRANIDKEMRLLQQEKAQQSDVFPQHPNEGVISEARLGTGRETARPGSSDVPAGGQAEGPHPFRAASPGDS